MDKKALSERDICTKYITPALKWAGRDACAQAVMQPFDRVVCS